MKIKMRVHLAGEGFSASPGDEIERPDDEAIRLIGKGYAVPMATKTLEKAITPPVVETRVEFAAAAEPVETVGSSRKPFRKGKRG